MTSTSQRWIAAIGVVVLLSLAVFVLPVSIAQAVQPLTQLQRAHGNAAVTYAATGPVGSAASVGRYGVFAGTTPVAPSTAGLIGGIAVTALVVALVAFLALGSRASRRGELAPVTSLAQAPSASPAAQYEDRERKESQQAWIDDAVPWGGEEGGGAGRRRVRRAALSSGSGFAPRGSHEALIARSASAQGSRS